MRTFSRLLLTVALACLAAPAIDAIGSGNEAHAEENPLSIGTQLMATSDVSVHRAEIAKGSRVHVTKLVVRSGRIDRVHVALPDGHVVKMPLGMVHSYFHVVHE